MVMQKRGLIYRLLSLAADSSPIIVRLRSLLIEESSTQFWKSPFQFQIKIKRLTARMIEGRSFTRMNSKVNTQTSTMTAFQATFHTRLVTNLRIRSLRDRRGPLCSMREKSVNDVEANAMTAAAATLILKHAARAHIYGDRRRPSTSVVRASMEQLEKVQKKNKVSTSVNDLYGQWRLVFTASKNRKNPLTSALFFPLRAHQTFQRESVEPSEHDGEFDNAVFLFGRTAFFRVIGPMRWTVSRNRLEFSVDRLKLKFGPLEWEKDGLDKEGYSLRGRTSKTLPFFTFFCIRNDIAVARGRSGGLALYSRVPDDQIM